MSYTDSEAESGSDYLFLPSPSGSEDSWTESGLLLRLTFNVNPNHNNKLLFVLSIAHIG